MVCGLKAGLPQEILQFSMFSKTTNTHTKVTEAEQDGIPTEEATGNPQLRKLKFQEVLIY